jgi:hypothetical protein
MTMPAAYTAAMSSVGLCKTMVRQRERNKPFLKFWCKWEDDVKRHVKYPSRCKDVK